MYGWSYKCPNRTEPSANTVIIGSVGILNVLSINTPLVSILVQSCRKLSAFEYLECKMALLSVPSPVMTDGKSDTGSFHIPGPVSSLLLEDKPVKLGLFYHRLLKDQQLAVIRSFSGTRMFDQYIWRRVYYDVLCCI